MILYTATKSAFSKDVTSNQIENKILDAFRSKLGFGVGIREVESWRNSLMYMRNAVDDAAIPSDASVALEYKIPQNSKRIDFIIGGHTPQGQGSLVIVELKQWTEGKLTTKDAIVETAVGGGVRETPHPSYQAWTYASLLQEFNTFIQDEDIALAPCAYLHNSRQKGVFQHDFYAPHLLKAPLYLRDDADKLTNFIKARIHSGDSTGLLARIDQGKSRPSKSLADSLASMLQGNEEFIMIDDQKVVFENALELARNTRPGKKNVLIIEGGPGSGKSVVAINLLVALTKLQKTSKYVTKNAAPRAVYEQRLTGTMRRTAISNLFVGSGAFTETEKDSYDALIIDEAHRLNEKSGLYANLGTNQVHELIRSSQLSVFCIDENQKVTTKDIGTKDEIRRWARKEKAAVSETMLTSQFRCNGSEAYLAWLDHTLQLHETENTDLSGADYDFQVFDDPSELRQTIIQLNSADSRNKSRIVAGYCWEWKSKKSPKANDIEVGTDFAMQWNLESDGPAWITAPESVEQAGCIHTCQGLELDYVGVIIGPDLVVKNGKVITDGLKRAKADQSLKGYRTRLKTNSHAQAEVDVIIKNTYRTLMTRGLRGCYIYCTDAETREYFRTALGRPV